MHRASRDLRVFHAPVPLFFTFYPPSHSFYRAFISLSLSLFLSSPLSLFPAHFSGDSLALAVGRELMAARYSSWKRAIAQWPVRTYIPRGSNYCREIAHSLRSVLYSGARRCRWFSILEGGRGGAEWHYSYMLVLSGFLTNFCLLKWIKPNFVLRNIVSIWVPNLNLMKC